MATWYKEGVFGELLPEAMEGLRQVKKLFAAQGEDLYITSVREGTHGPSSFHPSGRAWDMRPNAKIPATSIKRQLGDAFDVVDEGNHVHIEWENR